MSAKLKKILTVTLCIVLANVFVIVSVAWFADYWSSGSPIVARPGSNPEMPETVVWMYYSENDGAAEGAEAWVEQSITSEDPAVYIPPALSSGTGADFEYDFSSLHFGKVDNLVSLKDDNKVYMRFEFSKSVHGEDFMNIFLSYATFGYNYAEGESSVLDSIYLYKLQDSTILNLKTPIDGDGTAENEYRYIIEHDTSRPAAMQFLQFRYAVSENAFAPGTDDFATLEFSENAVPINCGRTEGTCTECAEGKCGMIHIAEHVSQITTDTYYLYIELTPLLDAFGMQENILDYFVPSYMLFDVKFEIEIS